MTKTIAICRTRRYPFLGRLARLRNLGLQPQKSEKGRWKLKHKVTALSARPALIFDLDGTLVDSVYQHVLAWRAALEQANIDLSVWRIHRRMGMSGGLMLNALSRETGRAIDAEQAEKLQSVHMHEYLRHVSQVRPLPGARELLKKLTDLAVPWAIATSGHMESARPTLDLLSLDPNAIIITRDQV